MLTIAPTFQRRMNINLTSLPFILNFEIYTESPLVPFHNPTIQKALMLEILFFQSILANLKMLLTRLDHVIVYYFPS